MIQSAAFGLVLLISTSVVGFLFTQKYLKANIYLNLAVINLAGMAALVWSASILEFVKKPFTPALCIILLLSTVNFIVRVRIIKLDYRARIKDLVQNLGNLRDILLMATMGLLSAFLYHPNFTSTKISFRIGPDLAGWSVATKYFCENSSREKLSASLVQQLGLLKVDDAFRNPIQFQSSYIGRAPSFTDQVTGEFLVGANRVGLPKLLSGYCSFSPDLLNSYLVGTIIWTVIVMSLLILGIFRMKDIAPSIALAATFVVVFNVNTVSVLMEGGYGQFISTPFLLSTIYFIQKQNYSTFSKPLVITFLVFSLNAYQDAIIIFGVVYLITIVLKHVRRGTHLIEKLKFTRKEFVLCVLVILANVHQINSFSSLLLERFKSSGTLGGWDQGKIAFPINLLGVFNWLPYTSENHSWGFGIFVLTIFLSMFFMIFAVRIFLKGRDLLTLAILISFLFISLLVYRKGLNGVLAYTPDGSPVRGTNNYQVWKLMAFATPILLLTTFSNHSNNLKLKVKNSGKKILIVLIILATTTSLTWMNDWIKYRSFSIETSKEFASEVLDKYDVLIIGNWTGSAVSLVLQGDVRYFLPSRGFQLTTYRSKPSRDLVYLLPRGQCDTPSCLSELVLQRGLESPTGFALVYKGNDIVAFKGVVD
jgi:hypothetical protein